MTIHEYATRFYQIILSKNNAVMEYITERGISRESIKKWRIGFATDGFSGLTDVLIKKSFSKKELIQSGLVVDNEGRIYDRFRG
jgi:DNA primase